MSPKIIIAGLVLGSISLALGGYAFFTAWAVYNLDSLAPELKEVRPDIFGPAILAEIPVYVLTGIMLVVWPITFFYQILKR